MPAGPPGSKHHPAGEVPRSNLIGPPQPSAPSALGQNHHLAGSVDWRRWCGRPNGSGLYLLIEPTFIKHLLHAEAGAGEGSSEQRRKGCGSGRRGPLWEGLLPAPPGVLDTLVSTLLGDVPRWKRNRCPRPSSRKSPRPRGGVCVLAATLRRPAGRGPRSSALHSRVTVCPQPAQLSGPRPLAVSWAPCRLGCPSGMTW